MYRAVTQGSAVRLLVTMMIEDGTRSRSHGIRRELLEAQAEALGVPMLLVPTSWEQYDTSFQHAVASAKGAGCQVGIFGDIDIDSHREWVERVCALEGCTALLPIWHHDRDVHLSDLLRLGFKAVVVAVRDGVLPPQLLGRVVDSDLLAIFQQSPVDLAGEGGEYHTFVVDGPTFRRPVPIEVGPTVLRDGVWFADLTVRD